MALMALIAAGQHGLLIQAVAGVIGVEEPVARASLERLLAAMARRLSDIAADPIEEEALLGVIASGGFQRYLDEPRALFGRDALRDGEGVLAYLYGSLEAARAHAIAIGPPPGLAGEAFARLMTLAASLLMAAMARRLEQQASERFAAAGPIGLLQELGRVALRGLADGTVRTHFRRASFRSRMAFYRLRPRRRRLDHGASIRELLGDLVE